MADAKVEKHPPCQFLRGLAGRCGKPTDNGWCSEHEHLKCAGCGQEADRMCDCALGPFCCGQPLCPNCRHEPSGNWDTPPSEQHLTKEVWRVQARKVGLIK